MGMVITLPTWEPVGNVFLIVRLTRITNCFQKLTGVRESHQTTLLRQWSPPCPQDLGRRPHHAVQRSHDHAKDEERHVVQLRHLRHRDCQEAADTDGQKQNAFGPVARGQPAAQDLRAGVAPEEGAENEALGLLGPGERTVLGEQK